MASREQLSSVGMSCDFYENNATISAAVWNARSCESCEHYKNKKCDINVFDKVLTGLDQT